MRLQKKIKKLALVVNSIKGDSMKLGETLTNEARTQGVEISATDAYPIHEGFLDGCDACCVLGGDGTMLGMVNECLRTQVPIFGVNQGKLGFLATFTEDEIVRDLSKILNGHYIINKRTILQTITHDGQSYHALNEVVIKGDDISEIINLRVFCNDMFVTPYRCDGLIFATPTGSTAYNLSANGPIIDPGADVLVMTPICPHTLSNRSVIFSNDETLKVEGNDSLNPIIIIDGREIVKDAKLPVKISIAQQFLPLLHPLNYSHFHILRSKLNWAR